MAMLEQQQFAANIIEIYKKYAKQWDQQRRHHFADRIWLERFLTLIPPSSQILDLGCGAAVPVAEYCILQRHAVTGIDSSPAMLELAMQRFPTQQWLQADMRQLHLNQRFGGILAWDSFFHLTHDDQRHMFKVFEQHAQSGTALMFSSGPSHGIAMGEMQGEVLFHASLAPNEYQALLHRHGFRVVEMRAEDPECTGHTVWLAQKI